jgi:hypothetical protein
MKTRCQRNFDGAAEADTAAYLDQFARDRIIKAITRREIAEGKVSAEPTGELATV